MIPSEPHRDDHVRRNLYGRNRHRRLRPGRRRAVQEVLPQRTIPGVSPAENPARDPLPRPALLGDATRCWLEIGFGTGEHLRAIAAAHPEIRMLGAEPYLAGVSALVAAIGTDGLPNIHLHPGDARDLLDVIPTGAIERAFVLYPDPWPKRRHAKRRFISAENLDALARVMQPAADLRVATDIPGFATHALSAVRQHPRFAWTANRPADWRVPWPDWPGTRYERKAVAAGRRPMYLTFRRDAGSSP